MFDQFWNDARNAERAEKSETSQQRMDWWREARFGMFIHWNMSSVAACEISWAREFYDGLGETPRPNPRPSVNAAVPEVDFWLDWMTPPVPHAVYDHLHKSFYPAMFDADAVVALARGAGMKYIVQVAKHHDGFCMWDTAFTDYSIMATPFRRDIIGEMAEACARAGMRYGIYYSQRDWHHPDYGTERMARYNEYMRHQIRELLTRHPNIGLVWFDAGGYPADVWETEALFRMMYELRPDIIINDRCGVPADFSTPEQVIGAFNRARDWESCMTFTGNWSWHGFQNSVIPSEQCLHILAACAGGDGNLLMNVGPMPTGQIDPREANRLEHVGEWLKHNGESIYGTRGGPYPPSEDFVSTWKGNIVYLHVLRWPEDNLRVPKLSITPLNVTLLTGDRIQWREDDTHWIFSAPDAGLVEGDTVIKLQLERPINENEQPV